MATVAQSNIFRFSDFQSQITRQVIITCQTNLSLTFQSRISISRTVSQAYVSHYDASLQ